MIWTDAQRLNALAEATRWLGVPHHNRMAKHPIGIDCINLVKKILEAAGIVDDRELPKYDPAVGLYTASNTLKLSIMNALHVTEANPRDPVFGDIAIMKTGQASGHCGWYADGFLYHALAQQCVIRSHWRHWQHRAESLLRITKIGYKAEPIICQDKPAQ